MSWLFEHAIECADMLDLASSSEQETIEHFLEKAYNKGVSDSKSTPDEMDWQPIETAPKDGQYILAYPCLAGIPLVITWGRVEDYPWSGSWRVPLSNKAPPYRPTHWVPLPNPPVQS